MILSRFNYLLNSKKYGFFIYNSVGNSFHKLSNELFLQLIQIEKKPDIIKDIEQETLRFLIRNKIIVDELDDDKYIIQKKYLSYANSFSIDSLAVVLVPTLNCNFACQYCYENNLPMEIMDKKTQGKVIQFIESFKYAKENVKLCWHGGEPLTAFNAMVGLLEMLYSNSNINITQHDLVTNGYLLTEDKVKVLKRYNLNAIQVTIDGMEIDHNKSRPLKSGMPTYKQIIKNVEYILQNFQECFVKIRINVHKDNMDNVYLLYNELVNKWENYNCYIYMIYVSPNDHCKVECIKLSDRVSFFKDLYRKHGINNIGFFPQKQEYGCSATDQNSYIIGPKGELYKCWVDVGKKERVIGTLDDELTNLHLVAEYLVGTDMYNDEKCVKCFLFPICDGGCNLARYETKMNKQQADNCPINIDDFSTLLELAYEKRINNQHISYFNVFDA